MARGQLKPGQRETLSQFLTRALKARGTNMSALSRRLAAADGKTPKTWERQLRGWGSPNATRLQRPNAAILSQALNADFLHYAAQPPKPLDVIGELVAKLEAMDRRLTELEARTPDS